jgi:deoxycytidylate deaminase
MASPYAPEIVIAFVAPSGTSRRDVSDAAARRLAYYGYESVRIRLSDYLAERVNLQGDEARFIDLRTPELQRAGDEFRSDTGRADALAFVAVNEIRAARVEPVEPSGTLEVPEEQEKVQHSPDEPVPRRAYLVWSLKHPREAETLRNIYQSRFLLISVYMPREQREDALAEKIAQSRGSIGQTTKFRGEAVSIISTDEIEAETDFGQDVRDAYPLADLFVDATDAPALGRTMDRAIDIAFGAPFETPTKDEYGMFFAHAAGLRSAELGRQVGAAITTEEGEVVAVGTNEVPRGTGGQYWCDDFPDDKREFRLAGDTSDRLKRGLVGQILEELRSAGWLAEERQRATSADMYKALEETRLPDLIEFGRAVHAELAAIVDAARRGVPIKGTTLYVTTFPCHHCARHIVGAGIRRVVYIYPYPKSLAKDLHGDALQAEMLAIRDPRRVRFEPFLGIAPRQYMNFFTLYERKDDEGNAYPVDDPKRTPRLVEEERTGVWNVNAYIEREQLAVERSALWFGNPPPDEGSEEGETR